MEANRAGNCVSTVPVIQGVVVFVFVFTDACKKMKTDFLNTRLVVDFRSCQFSCMLFLLLELNCISECPFFFPPVKSEIFWTWDILYLKHRKWLCNYFSHNFLTSGIF